MKRKLDKNKIYAFIGRTVVWTSIHILLGIAMFDVAINCMTVYRQEEVVNLSIEELKLLFKNFEIKNKEKVEINIDGERVAKLIAPSIDISKDNHD